MVARKTAAAKPEPVGESGPEEIVTESAIRVVPVQLIADLQDRCDKAHHDMALAAETGAASIGAAAAAELAEVRRQAFDLGIKLTEPEV